MGGKVQQNGTTLMVNSHKLDSMFSNENLKSFQTNLRWHLLDIILKGNPIVLEPKMKLKREFSIWRIKM